MWIPRWRRWVSRYSYILSATLMFFPIDVIVVPSSAAAPSYPVRFTNHPISIFQYPTWSEKMSIISVWMFIASPRCAWSSHNILTTTVRLNPPVLRAGLWKDVLLPECGRDAHADVRQAFPKDVEEADFVQQLCYVNMYLDCSELIGALVRDLTEAQIISESGLILEDFIHALCWRWAQQFHS